MAKEGNEHNGKKSLFRQEINIGRVTLLQKAQLFRYLSVLLRSGITIDEALSIIAEQSKGRFKIIMESIVRDVRKGTYLYSALSSYPSVFSEMIISIIRSGEIAGRLPENLIDLTVQLEKEYRFQLKIKGAMVYPIIILVGILGLSSFLAFFILPKILPLLQGLKVELPLTTRILIRFVEIIQYNWMVVIVVLGAVILFGIFIFRSKIMRPVMHFFYLRLPFIKDFVVKSNLTRFCRVFGSLLRSGIHVDQAVLIASNTLDNYYYKKVLQEVYIKTKKGSRISVSLSEYEHMFPMILTRMINVGEKTGNLDESLLYLAEFYEGEVQNIIDAFVSMLEPVLLLVMGILVGGVALSIITPIYKITGSIQQ